MTRPKSTPISSLAKYRSKRGYELREIAAAASISPATVQRIENGTAVRWPTAAKYLKVLEIELTQPSTFPSGLAIIDEEEKVTISFRE